MTPNMPRLMPRSPRAPRCVVEGRRPRSVRRGAALILAMETVFLVAATLTVLLEATQTEDMGTDDLILQTQASYLAESGAEYSIKQIGQAIADRIALPAGVGVQVLNGYLPGYFPVVPGAPAAPEVRYQVYRVGAMRFYTDSDQFYHQLQLYGVTARARVPDPKNPVAHREVYINKLIDMDMIPLFQYLAFYNKYDLEMLPGNDANWKGRVHSNRDIYVGAESSKTLNFNTSYLRSSGALRRTRKNTTPADSNHYMTGTVRVRKSGSAENAPVNDTHYPTIPARGSVTTPNGNLVPLTAAPNGYDSSFLGYDGNADGDVLDNGDLAPFGDGSSTRWDGTVRTAANGIPELSATTDISAYRLPQAGETPTYKYDAVNKRWVPATTDATHVPGFFLTHADYVILNNRLYDNSVPTSPVDITTRLTTNPVSEKVNLFDGREYNSSEDSATAGKVKVTEIDIAKLNTAVRTDTGARLFPTTGSGKAIYAYRTDATVQDPRGIRLVNGAAVNNKLTLVSEDPVYVKGDFNVTNKKGVSILCDAFELLSNEWNDSKTATSGLPVPTHSLQVNAAVISGGYETLPGKYNGGFENYPRFHEDWSAAGGNKDPVTNDWIKVIIRGSFISLFESKFARGLWGKSGVYTAPKRDWNFDTDLLTYSFLPLLFPSSVFASRVVWWEGREITWWP